MFENSFRCCETIIERADSGLVTSAYPSRSWGAGATIDLRKLALPGGRRNDMLQPLGISAEAEAVYVALGPLSSASVDDLAKLTGTTPDEVCDTLEELRKLGLATVSTLGHWRALPLLDVVSHLKAQRLSEIELASVAAESLESHLLAAGETQDDEVKILVGREAIVAAHRELLDSAKRELCFFDKPPYVQPRPDVTEEGLRDEPEWRAAGGGGGGGGGLPPPGG